MWENREAENGRKREKLESWKGSNEREGEEKRKKKKRVKKEQTRGWITTKVRMKRGMDIYHKSYGIV